MSGYIRYIKFSGCCEKFGGWKEETKAFFRHKGILIYLTNKLQIPTKDEPENVEQKMKIYEGNSKAWDFLFVSLTDIPFGIVRKCDENSHDAQKALIDKY